MPHVERTQRETISADVRAAVEAMQSPELGAADRIYTMGFCFGGRAAFTRERKAIGLDGVIGFYGSPTKPYWEVCPHPRTWLRRLHLPRARPVRRRRSRHPGRECHRLRRGAGRGRRHE